MNNSYYDVPLSERKNAKATQARQASAREKLKRAKELLQIKKRGYRSNPILQKVRPTCWPKQAAFLRSSAREVLFGGAAGGGKTDALLMSALMYADVPHYSALILRSSYANLSKSGSIMDRLNAWLRNIPQAQKRDGGRKWLFPTTYPDGSPGEPASIEFGYLATPGDQDNYLSAEYQFIGLDECSEIFEDGAMALYGRLRKPTCNIHKGSYDYACPICWRYGPLSKVPNRYRLATNPGGKFSEWVKKRYIPQDYLECSDDSRFARPWEKRAECLFCSDKDHLREACVFCEGQGYTSTYFIPSRAEDNYALDKDEYYRSLAHLSPIDRQRMLDGLWNISVDGLYYRSAYFRFYEESGEFPRPSFRLIDPVTGSFGGANNTFFTPAGSYLTFLTVDSALKANENCDYTVIAVWSLDQKGNLFLRDILRDKWPVAEIEILIVNTYARYKANVVVIEDASSGSTLIQNLEGRLPVEPYSPAMRDKGFRSTEAVTLAKGGHLFLPQKRTPWLDAYMSELTMFPNAANDDQFDVTSQAGWYATICRVRYGAPEQVIETHDQIARQVQVSHTSPGSGVDPHFQITHIENPYPNSSEFGGISWSRRY